MADDYIDRQKLLKDIEQYHLSDGKFQYWVEVQPSADVHPVTPMHWTPINPFNGGWSDVWRCSACGSQVSLGYCTNIMEYDFCPYCGAKDGEQNGTD